MGSECRPARTTSGQRMRHPSYCNKGPVRVEDGPQGACNQRFNVVKPTLAVRLHSLGLGRRLGWFPLEPSVTS